jgi:DNA-binding transcriptional LysR family regulator
MDLRQLEYFVAVAEEANFTRAAERVHVSQPGISAQIRELERQLGATLFDRTGRAATLTVAGEAALGHARATLAAAGRVRQAVDQVTGLLRGRLVVGMVTACTVEPLFDALSSFHRAHPGIAIELFEDNSDRLIARVRDGTADLALVAAAGAAPTGLPSATIVSEPIVALAAPGHPLAGRSRARLADVCRHPIVSLPEGTGIRAVLDQASAAQGLRPDIALQASAPDAVVDLARRGLGVAILSSSMAASYPDLHAVTISDTRIPAVLALVWGNGDGPALAELVRHARKAFALGDR